MGTPFSPLLSEEDRPNPYLTTPPVAVPQKQPQQGTVTPATKFTPPTTLPEISTFEDRLKTEGSGTSALSMILAIVGAAKGDFRGLQAIEESKRRTALGKSIVPEMRKVDSLTNQGKYREAGDYLNQVVSAYGPRAEHLQPFFTQLAGRINDKEKRFENFTATVNHLDRVVPKDHVSRTVVDSLKEGLAKGEMPSEEGFNRQIALIAPHIQQLNQQITEASLITGKKNITYIPQVYSAKDFDDFAGFSVGGKHNITPAQLADIHNNVTIKLPDGKTISPNSPEAQTIKQDIITLQPLSGVLKQISPLIPLDPSRTFQALKELGVLGTATRGYFGADFNKIEQNVADWITKQKTSEITAVTESDPRAISQAGQIPVVFDEKDPTFLTPITKPTTYADVKAANGKIGLTTPDILARQITPAKAAIDSLSLIPELLSNNTLETKGDVISGGLNQRLSAFLGYPLTDQVTVRQMAKTILARAADQVEIASRGDRPESSQDSRDMKSLREFITGDFTSTADMLRAVDYIRTRLGQIITRATGLQIPETVKDVTVSTPAASAAPAAKTTSPKKVTGQTTIETGPIKLPPEMERGIKEGIKQATPGGPAVTVPVQTTAPAGAPPPLTPSQKIKKAFEESKKP